MSIYSYTVVLLFYRSLQCFIWLEPNSNLKNLGYKEQFQILISVILIIWYTEGYNSILRYSEWNYFAVIMILLY